MSKKNVFLVSLVIVMGAIYVYYFTDFFARPVVNISARPRIDRPRGGGQGKETYSVSFSFDQKVKLTELKVVSLAELETNKYAHAAWHIISDSTSVPVKGIVYGDNIKGMKPKVPRMKPEPLQPNTKYRLILEAGKQHGEQDFEIPGRRAAAQ